LPGCTNVVFLPERGLRTDPGAHGIEYRDIRFEASDGVKLHAWYIPATSQARGTVVFAHGNAGNISTHTAGIAWLRERGYNVFAFDYRGYGKSEGTPSMPGVHRDMIAALRTADRTDELPRERLAVLGQSLGGAVATVATARIDPDEAPAALVVDSAPPGYRAIAREKLAEGWLTWPLQVPLSWLVTGDYAAIDAAASLPPIPKLFIGNRNDDTIPGHHAQRLCEAATAPTECWSVTAPGHIATFTVPKLRDRLVQWLDEALIGSDEGTRSGATPNEPQG
jgi:fermentation-respiration switch protein FrsA (DUF1100 family)